MFQNIFIFGCFISSALLFNMYWKKSCIANTSSNYIEPSVVAGMLVGPPYVFSTRRLSGLILPFQSI